MTAERDWFAEAMAENDREEAKARPRREALAAYEAESPRLVYRETIRGGTPRYRTIRLGTIRWIPAHVETSFRLDAPRVPIKRKRPDVVRIFGSGTMHDVGPERVADYVRRPTAKALARIEAAEAAIVAAREELKAATRAAFTYGKPIPVSTIRRSTSEREAIERRFA